MRVALALLLLSTGLLGPACAGKLRFFEAGDEARYRHRELGYEIAYPSVLDRPGWSTASLAESDLLVRHEDGSAWALASNCRATQAPLTVLAAELARATGSRTKVEGEPIEHAGLPGFRQHLVRVEQDRLLHLETVTLRGARCTYDWILIAPSEARMAELEPAFDAWWRSFRPGPGERAGGEER